jgi:hypothetical protein
MRAGCFHQKTPLSLHQVAGSRIIAQWDNYGTRAASSIVISSHSACHQLIGNGFPFHCQPWNMKAPGMRFKRKGNRVRCNRGERASALAGSRD